MSLDRVVLELQDSLGARSGRIVLSRLPVKPGWIRDRTSDLDRPRSVPPIELREAMHYRYEIEAGGEILDLQPEELFEADDVTQCTGRLRTGEHVGELRVRVVLRAAEGHAPHELHTTVDVAPRKFEDVGAFHSMLTDLADSAVESLHQGFAPSAARFSPSSASGSRLLYEQFAVLHSRLLSAELDWALKHVIAAPYESWVSLVEPTRPGLPARGSSRLARSLTRPGPRVATAAQTSRLSSLPSPTLADRTEASFDNAPNRFVKFTLERWLEIAHRVRLAVESRLGGPRARGHRAADEVIHRLEALLAEPLFRSVGRLHSFPAGNQVLLKREGYRQVLAAAALVEATVALELDIDDTFTVSSRSVADLYELWCFTRVARALAEACETSPTSSLFEPDDSALSLRLIRGSAVRERFSLALGESDVEAELYFNKPFQVGPGEGSSWTTELRPDVSVRVTVPGTSFLGGEHWIHFDAKYKVESGAGRREAGRHTVRDLLKMHAYRDGIRGSAAAYVLFPGGFEESFEFGAEPLPAIGAFPLRPQNAAADVQRLVSVFRELLQHVADESTRHRRAEFWSRTAYRGPGTAGRARRSPSGRRPPADEFVLLGYVRSPAHRAWVERAGMYNVRSGRRRGAVSLGDLSTRATAILLYGGSWWQGPPVLHRRLGDWWAADRASLVASGYPNAKGDSYLCCALQPEEVQPSWLRAAVDAAVAAREMPVGTPIAMSWLALLSAID